MAFSKAGLSALILIFLVFAVFAGSEIQPNPHMNSIAQSYVKLVLAVGQHDVDYVDAYYGPLELKKKAELEKLSLGIIDQHAQGLIDQLNADGPESSDKLAQLRYQYLLHQLGSLRARISMLNGKKLSFNEESKALYDAVAPTKSEVEFQSVLDQLDSLLPGEGLLTDRYADFRKQFIVPPDKVNAVFSAAIKECRFRTLQHIELPQGEDFTVEYVKDKPWSGYNWYQGNFRSLIQVNTDLPIHIDRAVDLAGHEGYPGHHVYNVLLEKHLVKDRGWIEFSVYPLFSPQSLIAEGTANFGIEVEFTEPERMEFEKNVLFPIAGLDSSQVVAYYRVKDLVDQLNYADNEAARRYLNGGMDRASAVAFLMKYTLVTEPRAEQRVRFFDTYRSYVINYNLGKDMVRQYIESRGGTSDHPEKRWEEFAALISSPRLPSGLQ